MSLNEINISTERLVLRGLILSDANTLFSYRSKPEIYKFQNWKPQTLKEAETFISEQIAKEPNTPDTWYQLGVLIKETNELIGDIGIHFIGSEDKQVEIGYTLSQEYQGMGYATEAVKGVLNYLFDTLKKHRITASIDPLNKRSIALLERIGMRKEAYFKKSIWSNGQWEDDIIYAILEEEWINQK
jgi:RimJ/RimL family protein N-acetyltransferase